MSKEPQRRHQPQPRLVVAPVVVVALVALVALEVAAPVALEGLAVEVDLPHVPVVALVVVRDLLDLPDLQVLLDLLVLLVLLVQANLQILPRCQIQCPLPLHLQRLSLKAVAVGSALKVRPVVDIHGGSMPAS